MPKPVYQIVLGLFLLSFTVVACNNKKDKKDPEPKEDTTKQKPVDPGDPVDGGNMTTPDAKATGDTVAQKPVDGGN